MQNSRSTNDVFQQMGYNRSALVAGAGSGSSLLASRRRRREIHTLHDRSQAARAAIHQQRRQLGGTLVGGWALRNRAALQKELFDGEAINRQYGSHKDLKNGITDDVLNEDLRGKLGRGACIVNTFLSRSEFTSKDILRFSLDNTRGKTRQRFDESELMGVLGIKEGMDPSVYMKEEYVGCGYGRFVVSKDPPVPLSEWMKEEHLNSLPGFEDSGDDDEEEDDRDSSSSVEFREITCGRPFEAQSAIVRRQARELFLMYGNDLKGLHILEYTQDGVFCVVSGSALSVEMRTPIVRVEVLYAVLHAMIKASVDNLIEVLHPSVAFHYTTGGRRLPVGVPLERAFGKGDLEREPVQSNGHLEVIRRFWTSKTRLDEEELAAQKTARAIEEEAARAAQEAAAQEAAAASLVALASSSSPFSVGGSREEEEDDVSAAEDAHAEHTSALPATTAQQTDVVEVVDLTKDTYIDLTWSP